MPRKSKKQAPPPQEDPAVIAAIEETIADVTMVHAEPAAEAAPKTPGKRTLCSVDGCTKQSQGPANNFMCRKCFKETNAPNPEVAASGKKTRALCTVAGCTKQGQGKKSNFMCRRHYKETDGGALEPPALGNALAEDVTPVHAPPKKTPAKKKKAAVATEGSGSPAKKVICVIQGCDKQSQGPRNHHMCRRHFNEAKVPAVVAAAGGDAEAAAAAQEEAAAKKAAKKAAKTPTSGRKKTVYRPMCCVPGCPKQSQGGRNDYMCRSHFLEFKKTGQVTLGGRVVEPGKPDIGSNRPSIAAAVAQAAVAGARAGAAAAAVGGESGVTVELPASVMPTDPELADMVRREVERIKRKQAGEDIDEDEDDEVPASKRSRTSMSAQKAQAKRRVAALEAQLASARAAEAKIAEMDTPEDIDGAQHMAV